MIRVFLEFGLFARKFFKPTFSRFSADALQHTPAFEIPFSGSLYFGSGETLPVAISSECYDAQINTKRINDLTAFFVGNIAGCQKIPFALSVSKVRLSLLMLQQTGMVLTNGIGNGFAPVNSPDRNCLFVTGPPGGTIRQNTAIVSNGPGRTKRAFSLFVEFVGVRHFRQATNDKLSRQTKLLFERIVQSLLQGYRSKDFILKGVLANNVTSRIATLQRQA